MLNLNTSSWENLGSSKLIPKNHQINKAEHLFQKIEDLSSRKSIDDSPWETINLHQAWGYQKYGSGQQIAIVDEGFYLTEAGASADHSDLDGKTVTAFGSFNTAVYSDDGDSTNDNNHGTAVAGAAAADLDSTFSVGVAPSASQSFACK